MLAQITVKVEGCYTPKLTKFELGCMSRKSANTHRSSYETILYALGYTHPVITVVKNVTAYTYKHSTEKTIVIMQRYLNSL